MKDVLTFLQHVFLANFYMFTYSNHMISTEIEQKKVEEPTLERMGGFMGWPAGGGGGGRVGGGHHPHLCWVKSISCYFKVILSLTNRFHVDERLFSNKSQMTSKCSKNKCNTSRRRECHGCFYHILTFSVVYY